MEEHYGTPYIIIDTQNMGIIDLEITLNKVANFFDITDNLLLEEILQEEVNFIVPKIFKYRKFLENRRISVLDVSEEKKSQINDIFNKVGMLVSFTDLNEDIVFADINYESISSKLGKSFCNIKYLESIEKKGYRGILKAI